MDESNNISPEQQKSRLFGKIKVNKFINIEDAARIIGVEPDQI